MKTESCWPGNEANRFNQSKPRLEFVRYLADERWVLARTKLSLQLQEELSPADLERK
jgi:hypothetical protein